VAATDQGFGGRQGAAAEVPAGLGAVAGNLPQKYPGNGMRRTNAMSFRLYMGSGRRTLRPLRDYAPVGGRKLIEWLKSAPKPTTGSVAGRTTGAPALAATPSQLRPFALCHTWLARTVLADPRDGGKALAKRGPKRGLVTAILALFGVRWWAGCTRRGNDRA